MQPTVRYAQPPGIFQNTGDRKLEEVSTKLGRVLQKSVVGRGAAHGDLDNDRDLGQVITANNGPARLLRNDNENQNDVLRVKTADTRSNRDGIGAKVTLKTSRGTRLFAAVKRESRYLSQSELSLDFGLGRATKRIKSGNSLDILAPGLPFSNVEPSIRS